MMLQNSKVGFGLVLMVLGSLLAMLSTSCSSVFSSQISGAIYDKQLYEQEDDQADAGIEDVWVFLYHDRALRDADFDRWYHSGSKDGVLPHERAEPGYVLFSRTDDAGEYAFSGFVWKELNPEFGKTADRQEAYLLMHHPKYGLQKNRNPRDIFITSDIDNTIPHQLLEKSVHEVDIAVRTISNTDKTGIAEVQVTLFVADKDEDEALQWPDEPSREGDTTQGGLYAVDDLEFPQWPDDTGKIRIELQKDYAWFAEEPSDGSPPSPGAWEENPTTEYDIAKGESYQYDWLVKKTRFVDQSLSGFVYEGTADSGVNGKKIGIFMDEDPADGTRMSEADAIDTTRAGQDDQDGFFEFTALSWSDSAYVDTAAGYSEKEAVLVVDEDGSGAWDAGEPKTDVVLHGDVQNRTEVDIAP